MINAWQQIENTRENVLNLRDPDEGTHGRRYIKSSTIPPTLNIRSRTMIYNSTARQMEQLLDVLPYSLQTVTGVKLKHSKINLMSV